MLIYFSDRIYERKDYMRKSGVVKLTAAALAVASVPFAVRAVVENPPDSNMIMNAALQFSQTAVFSSEEVDAIGNGSYILYKPEPITIREENEPQQTEATTQESSPQASDEEERELLISQNISEEKEDLSVFNNRSGLVSAITYTANPGENFLNLPSGAQVRNCTELSNDFLRQEIIKTPQIEIDFMSDEPQILIVHTHTSESYLPCGEYYDENYSSRTLDSSQNIVAVGARLALTLAQEGVCVLHDGTVHDYPLYDGSYGRSEATITRLLEEYPSIKIVLDIHRDAIEQEDGSWVAAVTNIDGREAAQVMIISACGEGYYYVPDYLQNLHFASALQDKMEQKYEGLTRPVLFDYCQYNQHITTGSLLIEIGSHGNTLEQALYSAELLGKSLAELLRELSE